MPASICLRRKISPLLILSVFGFLAGGGSPAAEPDAIRYVLSPRGLELHQHASPASAVAGVMPYGAKARLLEAAGADNLTVDNIPGGMARVEFELVAGYAFDGYLSQFPAPDLEGMETASYVGQLRARGWLHDILHETINRDWGGYAQEEEALFLPTSDFVEAFLIARRLHEIPPGIPFPPASADRKSSYPNPDKHPNHWNDELEVERDETGGVISMSYYVRGEGGGMAVEIRLSEEPKGIRIARILISD